MRSLLFAAILAALCPSPVMSQSVENTAPWDQPFLPPALEWNGASRALLADATNPWITDFERDPAHDFSPDYAATRAWFDRLDAASDLIRIVQFGTSPEGRPIYAVIASRDGATLDPAKPVLLAQAGIHPGEIDGKDAGMMLLRDIAFGDKGELIDHANLVLIPILSVDGHERASAYSRPNQRGPRIQGWRNTGTNQNLNRDFMKLDQPEMWALRTFINRLNPDLYLDIHVTDGLDYQYDVTYGFNGEFDSYSRSPASSAWLDDVFKPAINDALEAEGHIPGPLVFGIDDQDPKAGLNDGGLGERFSNGWGSAAHVPTVLIENHSLKPYEQRVLGTYVFMEASLRLLADQVTPLRSAIMADRALRPTEIPANFEPDPIPHQTRTFKGVLYETYASPASGRQEVRWLGRPDPVEWQLPYYGSRPSLSLHRPTAYWVPAYRTDLIERLRLHGLTMETLEAARTVSVEMLRLNDPTLAPRPNEGHVQASVTGVTPVARDWTFAPGSVRVPTDQPLGDIAVLLLEPQSSESFLAWGMFPEVLSRVEYIEGYAIAPLAEAMMAADPALKAEFEAKLAADPAFASNAEARLGWFYERTPFYDDRYRLYPVAREN
ncbi:M14 family metallopeptidase [Brevundimonas subvibrioides]|uniref:M14 family metallopeptidase n=1 Tax=Brevundimonas subvibrioides TaxID=74313 RepID=UPI0022B468A1|nr:M14 family metallopeptidase [Brevundimonas subvibrioides]